MLEALLGRRAGPAGPSPFELIPVEQFITATALTTLVGMNAQVSKGTVTPGGDTTPWMLFRDKGEIFVIPQKALRQDVFWASLANTGVVYGRDVTIAGCVWRVALMTGLNDPGTQWNKYMLGVTDLAVLAGEVSPAYFPSKQYASFNYADLGMEAASSAASFVQEYYNRYQVYRRGGRNSVYGGPYSNNQENIPGAWRPILTYLSGPLPW